MAGVFSLSPFNGDWQESFESFPPYDGYGRYVPSGTWIMGGNATVFGSMIGIYNAAPPPNLAYFGTAGGQAQIEDGCQGLFAGFDGITISFNEPIRQFGGYFATNRFPGMVFEFFDVQSDLFDTEQPPRLITGGTLTWYGWGFSKPVKSVRMQGDNLAMDFLQADLV